MFAEVAAILAIAALTGFLGVLLRQPLIVSFIAVGIIVGPSVLGIMNRPEHLHLLADIGVSLLLFLVGLKLDVQLIRTLGPVAVATGMGQVAFTSIFGFLICMGLGMDWVASAYAAVALTFSSTIIVVKLLSDKREIDSLHGRIALGFLIVQDLFVVAAMVVLSAVGAGIGETARSPLMTVFSGIILLGTVWVMIRYVAEPLLKRMAQTPELMVTFAVAWAVVLAAVSGWLGFGRELGGLLGGVSLASTSFRDAVGSRLSGVRDFLLLFFFIGLGAHLDLSVLGAQVSPAIALSAFVLIGNPLIVLAIMGYMGYRRRTGFLAGLTVAQISEFSLIFMAMGVSLGHVGPEAMGLVTLVGLVTITLSTYMIVYSHPLYARLDRFLIPFERKYTHREEETSTAGVGENYDVILFGLGRYGGAIARGLRDRNVSVLGIDFDPAVVDSWRGKGCPVMYGDAEDPDFPLSLPFREAKWIILAIPPRLSGVTHTDFRLVLTHEFRQAGFTGKIAVTSHLHFDAERVLSEGADVALLPYEDAAERAVELVLTV